MASTWAIFTVFARVGAVMIGGGYAMLPLLEDAIVRRRKWATAEELADVFALAQVLPGIIAVNASMLLGNRLNGLRGNLAAAAGMTVVPFALIVLYAAAYAGVREIPAVANALEGMRPAVAGMIFGMGVKMARRSARAPWAVCVAVGACAAVLLWNPPMVAMILAAAAAGLLWNAVKVGRAARKGAKGC